MAREYGQAIFQNRRDAGRALASLLKNRHLRDPLVLGIPRGGVVTGAVLARELDADLDVVLSRKLRAPSQPELAIGAVSEDGQVFIDDNRDVPADYLERERTQRLHEIERRKALYRAARSPARIAGRSVIITDDGIATGSTMIAALKIVRTQAPHELIVAVPVASPGRLEEVGRWCDAVECLHLPEDFWAIGQFYRDFAQVEDEEVIALLREFAAVEAARR